MRAMRIGLRRVLGVLITLAFLSGTVGAAFASSFDACEHDRNAGGAAHHQKHAHDEDANSALCLLCPCCAIAPTLPAAPAIQRTPQSIAYIIYPAQSIPLTGRSVKPDPSPPRSIA